MSNFKRRTEADGRVIVSEYKKSGLNQVEFARESGISVAVVKYWIKRLKKQTGAAPIVAPVRLLEVLPEKVNVAKQECRITLPGGISLEIRDCGPQILNLRRKRTCMGFNTFQ